MKRLFLFAAVAAMVFTSCMKTEVTEVEQMKSDNAIGFSAYTAQTTRGSVATLDNLKNTENFLPYNGFGVIATHSQTTDFDGDATTGLVPNFMFNEQVTFGENNGLSYWNYQPLKYWPEAQIEGNNDSYGKVSFFAYSPFENAPDAGTNHNIVLDANKKGFPTIKYNVENAIDNQIDLLTAQQLNRTKPVLAADDKLVKFTFGHVLSRIAFSARIDKQLTNTKTTYTVNNVYVYYKGEAIDKEALYTYSADGKGAWTNPTAQFPNMNAGDVMNGNTTLNVNADFATPTTLTVANKYLFMLPQQIAEGDMYVRVKYNVFTQDDNDPRNNSSVDNELEVKVPATDWQMGKAYNYVMVLSPTAVIFDAVSVEEWVSNENPEIVTEITTVKNVQELNTVIAGSPAGSSVEVTVTEAIGGTDNSDIVIPAGVTATQTPQIVINLAEGIVTGQIVKITATGDDYDGEVVVNVPAGTPKGSFDISVPNGSVTINGGNYGTITATTGPNTLVIGKLVKCTTLQVNGGNVKIFGNVTSISKSENEDQKIYWGVKNEAELRNVLTNKKQPNGSALTGCCDGAILMNDIAVANQIDMAEGMLLDGEGFTLSRTTAKVDNSNNSVVRTANNVEIKNIVIDGNNQTSIHGINMYCNTNVKLNNMTVRNAGATGINVNGSTVVADKIVTENNNWGAINVAKGSGANIPNPKLTLTNSTINETPDLITKKGYEIWSDNTDASTTWVNAEGFYVLANIPGWILYSSKTPWEGNGTANDPYIISTVNDMRKLAMAINYSKVFDTAVYQLKNDITLGEWLPIGTSAKPFKGTFDGNNHKIIGMNVTNNVGYGNGLFGGLKNATIKDLYITGATVRRYETLAYTGNIYGILTGYALGGVVIYNVDIDNCAVYGYGKVGPLVGMAYGKLTLQYCDVTNTVVSGGYNCGGLMGLANNGSAANLTIANCTTNATWQPCSTETYVDMDTTLSSDSSVAVKGKYMAYKYDGVTYIYAAWGDWYTDYYYTDSALANPDYRLADGLNNGAAN